MPSSDAQAEHDSQKRLKSSTATHPVTPSGNKTADKNLTGRHKPKAARFSGPVSIPVHEDEDKYEVSRKIKTKTNAVPPSRGSQAPCTSTSAQYTRSKNVLGPEQGRSTNKVRENVPDEGGAKANNKPCSTTSVLLPLKTAQFFAGGGGGGNDQSATGPQPTKEPLPTKQSYRPKAYIAKETPTPLQDLFGEDISATSTQYKLWAVNQHASPFLQLPGELRNRIYELVLGGYTILIDFQNYTFEKKVMIGRHSDKLIEGCFPVFKYHCTVHRGFISPFNPTVKADVVSGGDFRLLNGVCRQFYLEAAILPYSLNRIAFQSHRVMFNFLFCERRFNKAQRMAITALHVRDAPPQPNLLALMGSLKHVYVAYDQQNRNGPTRYIVLQDAKGYMLRKQLSRQDMLDGRY